MERGLAASALWSLIGTWTVIAFGSRIAAVFGRDTAVLVSFAAATALIVGTRKLAESRPLPLLPALVGGIAGFVSYPAWGALITVIGITLQLAPLAPTPPGAASPALWIAMIALAPIFEELLYRERLLPVLRARLGAPLAVIATSILFALPHLEPWNVLGTFLVGLMLGTLYSITSSVALCIAIHAGLNLACLVCGVPAVRFALAPIASAVLSTALVAVAIVSLRSRQFRVADSSARPVAETARA